MSSGSTTWASRGTASRSRGMEDDDLPVMYCDNCQQELRCGMPDGRYFELVHVDSGASYCHLLPGDRSCEMTVATYHGKASIRYRMG